MREGVELHKFFCDDSAFQEGFLRCQTVYFGRRRESCLAPDAIGSLQAEAGRFPFILLGCSGALFGDQQ
jgi:hypothetical protein